MRKQVCILVFLFSDFFANASTFFFSHSRIHSSINIAFKITKSKQKKMSSVGKKRNMIQKPDTEAFLSFLFFQVFKLKYFCCVNNLEGYF